MNFLSKNIAIMFSILLIPICGFCQHGMSISSVDGLQDGLIVPGSEIMFRIHLNNNSGQRVSTVDHGFRVYLSNNIELTSAQFQPVKFGAIEMTGYTYHRRFDGYHFFLEDNADGFGADTVSFSALSAIGIVGFEDGFDQDILSVTTGAIIGSTGDSLCIDSCFASHTGLWRWSYENNPTIDTDVPWGGPYCFEIAESCCLGTRGNINGSPDDQLDISDLEFLITFMFRGGSEPPCFEESDLDGDGSRDVSDLVALVSYMFMSGLPPTNCF